MEYYELTCTVYLKKDIQFNESFEIISKNINKVMLQDIKLSQLHVSNSFKYYVFNSFFPIEIDKLYKAGKVYVFNLRCLNKVFAEKINCLLRKINSDDFKVISVDKKIVRRHQITELTSITPVIITTEGNKNWVIGDSIEMLQRRLRDNLEKKYNAFNDDKLNVNEDFVERIEILNRVPISIKYKNTKLLGIKLKLYIKLEEECQKLAFIAEAVGIGEKGSAIGAGFCNAQYLK